MCSKPTNGIFNEAPKVAAKVKEMAQKQKDSNDNDDEDNNDDEEEAAAATTKVGTAKGGEESDGASSHSEGNGVLSKKDKEVFKEYKERAKEVDRKKYQS